MRELCASPWRRALAWPFVLIAIGNFASGTPINTTSLDSTTEVAFGASNSDLINAGSTGLASSTTTGSFGFGGAGILTNGSLGAQGVAGDLTSTDSNTNGSVTYTLKTSGAGGSPAGFDITSIDTFSGWADKRVWQSLTISTSTNGVAFTSLGTFTYQPAAAGISGHYTTKMHIADSSGILPLATGVVAVRFALPDNGFSNQAAYREFDVFGAASVPEPGSLVLLGLGMLGLLWIKTRSS